MVEFFRKIKKFFTLTDVLIILTVCVLSLGSLTLFAQNGNSKTIVIELDGKVYASYTMQNLGNTPKKITIESQYGKNILEIDRQGADMVYSDCPMQIDVKHRKITTPGETIVCAPHKLLVYITGESEIDAVSG